MIGITKNLLLLLTLSCMAACTSFISERFANNLGNAILTQDDPELAAASLPSFIVLMDSLVLDSPNDPDILSASADLNGAYASLFVTQPERASQMADKALNQARSAICIEVKSLCQDDLNLDQLTVILQNIEKAQLNLLYSYGSAWAGWINSHRNNWNALAQVPNLEAVMKRVIELNEEYQWGRAHLYLAVINSQLPPSLGGKPEIGRMHFEKAIKISNGNDLLAKVEFARHYARLMFEQTLHDQLLNEVLETNPMIPTLNLSNAIAKQQAKELLSTSLEYFGDD